jgi:hypothetical protein
MAVVKVVQNEPVPEIQARMVTFSQNIFPDFNKSTISSMVTIMAMTATHQRFLQRA